MPLIHNEESYSMGAFENYVDRKGWVVGQSNVYANKVNDLFYLLCLSMKGGWVATKVENSVYVVVECPLFGTNFYH